MKRVIKSRQDGFALLQAIVFTLVCGIMSTSLLFMARSSVAGIKPKFKSDHAFLMAQSALQKTKYDMFQAFKEYVNDGEDAGSATKIDWFDNLNGDTIGKDGFFYTAPTSASLEFSSGSSLGIKPAWSGGKYSVDISLKRKPGSMKRYVKFKVTAEVDEFKRCVEEVATYGFDQLDFTFAIFAERAPDLGQARVDIEGDIFLNDQWSRFDYPKTINGDLYSTGNIADMWMYWDLSQYVQKSPESARPISTEANPYDFGYTGEVTAYPYQEPVPVPRMDNFDEYIKEGYKIEGSQLQGRSVLSHNQGRFDGDLTKDFNGCVYEGNGPDGIAGTPDDGSLVLDGEATPIIINGPVVVPGDLVIRGTVTGEGTFFVGGNLHVVDDLEYHEVLDNPDGYTQDQLEEHNKDRDLVGYAVNGTIVLGNYTSKNKFKKALNEIEDAQVSAADMTDLDSELGSDTYKFNGDYTDIRGPGVYEASASSNNGGGKNKGGSSTSTQTTEDRKFYESVVSNTIFTQPWPDDTAPPGGDANGSVDSLHGVFVSNHLIAGNMGTKAEVIGSLVTRDLAVDFDGNNDVVWDNRLVYKFGSLFSLGSKLRLSPVELEAPERIAWRELPVLD